MKNCNTAGLDDTAIPYIIYENKKLPKYRTKKTLIPQFTYRKPQLMSPSLKYIYSS